MNKVKEVLKREFTGWKLWQVLWMILAIVVPIFNPVSGIVPLIIPALFIKLRGIISAGKGG